MKTLWDPAAHAEITARLYRLTPETPARWGRMNCAQMVVHATDALALYLGDLRAAGKRTPLQYAPLKHAFVYLIPMPKNVPTAPELIARAPGTWTEEIARLHNTIEKFVGARDRLDWPPHPLFGVMSCRAYGVLGYKHTDHHLRQFGV